jgi:enoyl-CoA hydratase/carnithine racemase
MVASGDSILEIRSGAGIETWMMGCEPVNALNLALLSILRQAVERVSRDDDLSVIVLSSSLAVFSGGADAGEMAKAVQEHGSEGLVRKFNQDMDFFRELCIAMRRSPCLFIAALNGHTLAGGLELAAACDLRFCANVDRLRIGVPEMNLFGALPSGGGGAQFITRLMGPSRALKFILDAKPVSPKRAVEMGLVDELFTPENLLEGAEKFAGEVAGKAGKIGIAAAKRTILGGAELPLHEALEVDHTLHWDAMRRGNFRAGVAAFVSRFGSDK